MTDAIDASSGDAGGDVSDGLDLTPRDTGPEPSAGRKWLPRLVLVGIAAALVAVLFQTLGDASLFFYNVDEAVERRAELGDDRFTLQGTPINSATTFNAAGQEGVAFTVTFEGIDADVVHIGSPAELFQPSVPVVLEGRWIEGVPAGADFAGGANDGYCLLYTSPSPRDS